MHTNKNTFFKLLNSIAGLALASVMNTATAADVAVEVKFAAVVHTAKPLNAAKAMQILEQPNPLSHRVISDFLSAKFT